MKLIKARVKNFRCIEDSEEFEVPQVTCLVGKNEAGKSALLQALCHLNPHREDAGLDLVQDFPRRHLAAYESRHASEQATLLETTWVLSESDLASIERVIGPTARTLSTVEISLRYPKEKTGEGVRHVSLSLSSEPVVQHLVESANATDDERQNLIAFKTIEQLKSAVSAADGSPAKQWIKDQIAAEFKAGEARDVVAELIDDMIPRFVFFSQYDVLKGRVHLETLHAKLKPKQRLEPWEDLFLDLCAFAGASIEELVQIQSFEALKAKFEAAQNRITEQVFEYWTSNEYLSAEFSRDPGLPNDVAPFNSGHVFNLRIRNDLHGNTVPFSERSSGFVWFFSFVVLFDQVRKRYGDNIIILLDEPGLNLHARAQGDLLRYIEEKLRPSFQVLYTTHSLFMVPANDLLSARIVEDVIEETQNRRRPKVLGTKVRNNVLAVTKESLFPLQGALGFEITQTLFVGENTLMVEGPSDLLYLTAYSKTLRERGRTYLDQRWTTCPVGGLDKVPAFIALFGQKLKIAVLVDLAHGTKGKVKDAERLCADLRLQGRVLTYAQFTHKSESDVEDMLGDAGYIALINDTYSPNPPITPPADGRGRVLGFVDAEMRSRGDFNHYDPAENLLQKRSELLTKLPDSDLALSRFEELFKSLNALLSSPA
jgi:predicted ATPase